MMTINYVLFGAAVVTGAIMFYQMLGYCYKILHQPDDNDFYGDEDESEE